MKNIYTDVFSHVTKDVEFAGWDIGTKAVKYVSNMYDCSLPEGKKITGSTSTEDQFFNDMFLVMFFSYENPAWGFDWSTNQIGTWIAKSLYHLASACPYISVSEWQKKLNEFFIMENNQISILDIGHLFSILHVDALVSEPYQGQEIKTSFEANKYVPEINLIYMITDQSMNHNCRLTYYPMIQGDFKKCFKEVKEKQLQTSLPCTQPIQVEECLNYCDWHSHYIKTVPFEEFLTLMKYGLPQRKWISNQVSEAEKKVATELFGQSNVIKGKLKELQSPAPLSVFCEKGKEGFQGEDIGWLEAACDEFYPTPTDQGICLTENVNIQEVMHGYEKYETLMESSFQEAFSEKITGGTKWSYKTFVVTFPTHPYNVESSNCLLANCQNKDLVCTNICTLNKIEELELHYL